MEKYAYTDKTVYGSPRIVDTSDLHGTLTKSRTYISIVSFANIEADELHKPLIRRQPQPVANALPRSHASNLEGRIRLPLHHRDVATFVVLPNCARRSRGLGDDAVRDARLWAKNRAIKDCGIELCELECDAVGLHRSWD